MMKFVDYEIERSDSQSMIKNDMESIHQFIHDASHVDFMGRFKRNSAGVHSIQFWIQ